MLESEMEVEKSAGQEREESRSGLKRHHCSVNHNPALKCMSSLIIALFQQILLRKACYQSDATH